QGALQIACAYDMRVPQNKLTAIHSLLALVNERLWLGHFDIWSDEGVPMFRHALLLHGSLGASDRQIESLIDSAVEACERFYPAFQFVLWAGKSPTEAIAAAMLETV